MVVVGWIPRSVGVCSEHDQDEESRMDGFNCSENGKRWQVE